MKTIEIKVYEFDELSDEAKEKALQSFAGINVDDGFWYESIMDDAKEVGISICSFDIEKYCYIKVSDTKETADKIINSHGIESDTYKDSISFQSQRGRIIDEAHRDENVDFESEMELDQQLYELERDYIYNLAEDYRIMLRKVYEYQTSEECIAESIRANQYLFTEDGKQFIE